MRSAKELFERLKTDEAFAKEFTAAIKSKREAGAKSYYETYIPAAEERGYELTAQELDEVIRNCSEITCAIQLAFFVCSFVVKA